MSAHVPASIGNDWRNGMEPIPDWVDDTIVYVDGRLSRNRARMEVCRHNDDRWGIFYRDMNARRVYMRTVFGQEALDFSGGEMDCCTIVCDRDDEGALPMWRVKARPWRRSTGDA